MKLTSRTVLRMFDVANIWETRAGQAVRLVSANDHVHSRRSAHYAGLAIDLHSSAPDALAAVMRRLGYRVLWKVPGHYTHVHVEADAALTPRRSPAAATAPSDGPCRAPFGRLVDAASPAAALRHAPRVPDDATLN